MFLPFPSKQLRCLALGLLACVFPLQAQLDPKLQRLPSSFMTLFQNTDFSVKPEILMLLDFSGSMRSLMYHPLFFSNDVMDKDDYGHFQFTLSGTSPNRKVTVSYTGTKKYGGGTFSLAASTILVCPDGAQVTEAIANSSKKYPAASPTLDGTANGASDVRNWIRAASHVRFKHTNNHSVDIPIPWKIIDGSFVTPDVTTKPASPLPSLTVYDSGTSANVEFDLNYATWNGNSIFCQTVYPNPGGDITPYPVVTGTGLVRFGVAPTSASYCTGTASTTDVVTSVIIHTVAYRPSYLEWVFTATYPGSRPGYGGKFVTFDALDATKSGGQGNKTWGQGFGRAAMGNQMDVPQMDDTGNLLDKWSQQDASQNTLPWQTRAQAVKRAAITTWVNYQKHAMMAYRFLDYTKESGIPNADNSDPQRYLTAWMDYNSQTYTFADPTGNTATSAIAGGCSNWQVMNGDSANKTAAMKRLASYFPYGGTPITHAVARSLAQFLDPDNAFENVETGADAPLQCQRHFLLLFTDGMDNNNMPYWDYTSKLETPYLDALSGNKTGNMDIGNQALKNNPSNLNGGNWWNFFTLAAAAAHASDKCSSYPIPIPGSYPSSGARPSGYLPFSIKGRGAVTFSDPHPIQTMTIGVSLGGAYTDSTSPKHTLFLAAAMGNPKAKSWDTSQLRPYTPFDASNPDMGPTADSTYFFDGSNPDKLMTSLDYALRSAIQMSNINTSGAPNMPFVGGALSNEALIATFTPPGGKDCFPDWSGDLMMFKTKMTNNVPVIVDKTSGEAITKLDATTAVWSASAAMTAKGWRNRKLYTRLPLQAETDHTLKVFSDLGDDYTAIKDYVTPQATSNAEKQSYIQWVMGADLDKPKDPISGKRINRASLMGDVIGSTPASLEYDYDSISSKLSTTLKAALPTDTSIKADKKFRLIAVGDNRGWMHGFGEVTCEYIEDGKKVMKSAVEELWAFMPPDFLRYLDFLRSPLAIHRYMVDGSPCFYHLDLPPANAAEGNGKVDQGGSERAVLIFGLGLGGRSYYALNVKDPFNPAHAWALIPDSSIGAAFGDERKANTGLDLATLQTIVKNMGFSTCQPAIGRVLTGTGAPKDVVFLGGGYSQKAVEKNFSATAPVNPLLGRSIMALDAYTGKFVAAVDMSGIANVGPISAGLVPVEFIQGSGLRQRAYFTDLFGGLWCWDQNSSFVKTGDPLDGFRQDSSYIDKWASTPAKLRKVFQDGAALTATTAVAAPGTGNYYNSLPGPFIVGRFPGVAKTEIPSTVGIAMVSGDKHNPLDNVEKGYERGKPTQFRVTVVFDRQDTPLWVGGGLEADGVIKDGNLLEAGDGTGDSKLDPAATDSPIAIGSSKYFLNDPPYFGFNIVFPLKSGSLVGIPKGYTTPMVSSNSLFYSYLVPTDRDLCGKTSCRTYARKLCDLYVPRSPETGSKAYCVNGNALGSLINLKSGAKDLEYWDGIASGFSILGGYGVLQAGAIPTTSDATDSMVGGLNGQKSGQFPKVRTWRVVH